MTHSTTTPTPSNGERRSPATAAWHLNPFAHYLFALTIVSGCYFAYLKLAVPLIEWQPDIEVVRRIIPATDLIAPPLDKSRLISLLPKDAWELRECKTITTPTGTILFQEFTEQENGTMQVKPFTLISGLGEAGLAVGSKRASKPPTVLRCLEGANLRFDRPVSEALSRGAKLALAGLTGDVDIYRPPSQPDKSDMLHVLTRNVQVDTNRIYTLDRVAFSYGPHRGSGRNLRIDLLHDDRLAPGQQDFSSIAGVSKLELAFLDHLRIEPSKKSNQLPSKSKADEDSESIFSSDSPLEVVCTGPFVFDFKTNSVSISENVVAKQIDATQNSIQCDRLNLTFTDAPATTRKTTSVSTKKSADSVAGMSNLKLQRFVATGSPAVVTSNSHPAKFTADELVYDALANQVSGHSQSQRLVTLITPNHQIVTKQLRYALTEDGSLGAFSSDGAGRLLKLSEKNTDELFVTWNQRLSTTPNPRLPNRQSIKVEGQAKIRMGKKLKVDSEALTLIVDQHKNADDKWEFTPIKVTANSKVTFKTPKIEGTTDRLTATWIQPQTRQTGRNHRVGRIAYPQQNEGQFVELAIGQNQGSGGIQRVGFGEQQANPRAFVAQRQDPNSPLLAPPVFVEQTRPASQVNQAPAKKKKLVFRGRETTLQLSQALKPALPTLSNRNPVPEEVTLLVDLVVTGSVNVVQQEITATGIITESMEMSGDYLRVVPQPKLAKGAEEIDLFRAIISSEVEPARVATPSFRLLGTQINLDQQANKIWVKGSGKINFESDKLQSQTEQPAPTGAFSVAPIKDKRRNVKSAKMQVSWDGGMIFDGDSIYFEHGIELKSEQSTLTGQTDNQNGLAPFTKPTDTPTDKRPKKTITLATGEALKVELNRSINLQDLEAEDDAFEGLDARELVFVDWIPETERAFNVIPDPNALQNPAAALNRRSNNLVIKSTTFDHSDRQIAQRVVRARQATVDVKNELVIADGPGSIITHQLLKNKKTAGRSRNPLSRFNKSPGKGNISFVQINFEGKLRFDGKDESVNVTQRVRTAYMNVASWDQGIDPDAAQKQSFPGVVSLTCERLNLSQWQPRGAEEAVHELDTKGNVRITSEALDATADRVSYSQSTDMLVVEGTPRSDARFWFGKPNGGGKTVIDAQKLRYRLSDQFYEVLATSISSRQ